MSSSAEVVSLSAPSSDGAAGEGGVTDTGGVEPRWEGEGGGQSPGSYHSADARETSDNDRGDLGHGSDGALHDKLEVGMETPQETLE